MIAATAARDSAANYQPLIRDLPPDERPRERLAIHGVAAPSTAELLAITLRIGRPGESALAIATRLLASFEGLEGLAQASFGEPASQPSMGGSKSAQIKAGLELGKQLLMTTSAERPVIGDPRDVNNFLAGDMGVPGTGAAPRVAAHDEESGGRYRGYLSWHREHHPDPAR